MYNLGSINGLEIKCGHSNLAAFGEAVAAINGPSQQAQWDADILCRHHDSGIAFGVASLYVSCEM